LQIGDLVTLSVRGRKLSSVHPKYTKPIRSDYKNPVGLLYDVQKHRSFLDGWINESLYHHSLDRNTRYYVKWIGDGPAGRKLGVHYFIRSDLKHYKD